MMQDAHRARETCAVTEERDRQGAERDDENVSSFPPAATLAMLAIIVAVFAAMVREGHGDIGRAAYLFGDKEPDLIRAGQWWRLITPIFLHGSWIHLLVNGASLLWFGGQFERIYGARKYFLIYMISGIAGNVLSYLLLPAPSVGASGALFGLIGAGIVFPIRFGYLLQPEARGAILKQLALVAVINLGLSFIPGIDRYAHFGGFLGGAFTGLFLVPNVLDDRPRNGVREALLTGAALLMIGLVALAGSRQWKQAHEEIRPEIITYAHGGGNAAYRFQLSSRWHSIQQHDGSSFVWSGPQGATIRVVDSLSDSDLFEHAEQWRAAQGAVATSIVVDGRSGTLTTVNTGVQVTQSCVILAEGCAIEVVLTCPKDAYATAANDYVALLGSIRFLPSRAAVPPFPLLVHSFSQPSSSSPAQSYAPGKPVSRAHPVTSAHRGAPLFGNESGNE